jgi:hypothetical protein
MRINLLVSSRSHSAGQLKQENCLATHSPLVGALTGTSCTGHGTQSPSLPGLATWRYYYGCLPPPSPSSPVSSLFSCFIFTAPHPHPFLFLLFYLFCFFNLIPYSHPPAAAPSSQPHHPPSLSIPLSTFFPFSFPFPFAHGFKYFMSAICYVTLMMKPWPH